MIDIKKGDYVHFKNERGLYWNNRGGMDKFMNTWQYAADGRNSFSISISRHYNNYDFEYLNQDKWWCFEANDVDAVIRNGEVIYDERN